MIDKKEAIKLFNISYKHPSYLDEISLFKTDLILSETRDRIQRLSNRIIDMVQADYKYPPGTDETKLFDYWADRLNNGEYHKLKRFERTLILKIIKQRGGVGNKSEKSLEQNQNDSKSIETIIRKYMAMPEHQNEHGRPVMDEIDRAVAAELKCKQDTAKKKRLALGIKDERYKK